MPMYEIIDDCSNKVVVRFPEFADERRMSIDDDILRNLIRSKERLVFDLSKCQIVDTPWLRLIAILSKEADIEGKMVAVAGANAEIRRSTDYLGHTKHLHMFAKVSEALKS